jgi:hypothetical protein
LPHGRAILIQPRERREEPPMLGRSLSNHACAGKSPPPPRFHLLVRASLALSLAASAPHPSAPFADELSTRPLPAALRALELLQHVVPPSAREVTGDAGEPKLAPPLGPPPSTPPPLAFLRPGSTPPSLPRVPRLQGAPVRPLHWCQ